MKYNIYLITYMGVAIYLDSATDASHANRFCDIIYADLETYGEYIHKGTAYQRKNIADIEMVREDKDPHKKETVIDQLLK